MLRAKLSLARWVGAGTLNTRFFFCLDATHWVRCIRAASSATPWGDHIAFAAAVRSPFPRTGSGRRTKEESSSRDSELCQDVWECMVEVLNGQCRVRNETWGDDAATREVVKTIQVYYKEGKVSSYSTIYRVAWQFFEVSYFSLLIPINGDTSNKLLLLLKIENYERNHFETSPSTHWDPG